MDPVEPEIYLSYEDGDVIMHILIPSMPGIDGVVVHQMRIDPQIANQLALLLVECAFYASKSPPAPEDERPRLKLIEGGKSDDDTLH